MSGPSSVTIDEQTLDFYRKVMRILTENEVEFLVGGAYAFGYYTGIKRYTKDYDLFLRQSDVERAMNALSGAGYQPELTFPHWLGKVVGGEDFVDLIFGAGNGIAVIDEVWFEKSVPAEVFGVAVRLCPAEEMIWSKGLIMERERYDGADVAHLLFARADRLDWERLIDRFDGQWRVLFTHLVLFAFIYPGHRNRIPRWVLERMMERLGEEMSTEHADRDLCQGTLLSRQQYLPDLERGFLDARLEPRGKMSRRDIDFWTAAIGTID
jgi:Nucleotidyl transferase of unknown function (DUF2204)